MLYSVKYYKKISLRGVKFNALAGVYNIEVYNLMCRRQVNKKQNTKIT